MNNEIRYGAFVWDREKEEANIQRHGLGFQHAAEAFADPRHLIAKDDAHSRGEERLFCIGLVNGRVATVRFTYRGRAVRIFGAGYWRKGKKLYEEKNPRPQ